MYSYRFDDVFEMFDNVFGMKGFVSGIENNSLLYPAPQFPPSNVFLGEKSKDLIFEFALAGYKKEEVDIEFAGDFLVLKLKSKKKDLTGLKVLREGIKTADVEFKYACPSDKYNKGETTANFVDGLLTIKIPSKAEIKASKIQIV